MLSALILTTFVIFIVLIGIATLTFLIPFMSNLFDKTKRGELFISLFEMFVTIFVLLTTIFGSFSILIRTV